MIDIVGVGDSSDIRIFDAQTSKAGNVLSIQIGSLEYAPTFGIDLAFFIDENLQFQNDSFKSYLIQRLAQSNINVSQVVQELEAFVLGYSFQVGDSDKQSGGFIK